MDIYIVLDGARVVGVSARLQGAELIRTDEARRLAESPASHVWSEADYYDRMTIENHELQDVD